MVNLFRVLIYGVKIVLQVHELFEANIEQAIFRTTEFTEPAKECPIGIDGEFRVYMVFHFGILFAHQQKVEEFGQPIDFFRKKQIFLLVCPERDFIAGSPNADLYLMAIDIPIPANMCIETI